MGTAKEAVSFDQIIKAGKRLADCLGCMFTNPWACIDRQRRKNEALANEIFGKGRRASAPGSGLGSRKTPSGPSLASRIGVAKVQCLEEQQTRCNSWSTCYVGLYADHWIPITSDLLQRSRPSPMSTALGVTTSIT